MREQVLGFALCATLLLSGCATVAPSRDRRGGHSYDADRAKAGACADWRWIGVKTEAGAKCPVSPGWKERQLFQPAKQPRLQEPATTGYGPAREALPQAGEATAKALEELNRFCVYESKAKSPGKPFESPGRVGLADLDRDCAAISRSADLSDGAWTDLAEHFLAQAGQPPTPMNITQERGVRLAFLDTQPTGETVPDEPGNSRHGYTLAHIARHLVCSPDDPCATKDPTCAAMITTQLAMPVLYFDARSRRLSDIDEVRGGGIGTQADLANAIYREVDAWNASRGRAGAPEHLVLNLSLGWDPKQIEGIDAADLATVETGTQAVFRALSYASTLDVLVLAAAGNKRDCCPASNGPLLPAAWEQPPKGFVRQPPAPLIYAVGGVRSDGQPLRNARSQGMPRRVAVGENGIVSAGRGRSTWLYTGSSVATAVVSSTAAVVWDTFPNLGSHEVMKIIDESGQPLSFDANFWYDGSGAPPTSARISLCAAVKKACAVVPAASPAACPVTGDCRDLTLARTTFPAWAWQPPSRACHPWLVPQPDDPPCPPCEDKQR